VASVQLELRDVTVAFDGKPILDRVSLTVGVGESVVLIGPSGQGKTLILKLLAGLIEPDSGEALVNGEILGRLPTTKRDKIRLTMGMLFQRNALFDSLTVFENVAFPLREKAALAEAAIRARVEEYLGYVGLADARDLRPDEISGGMQKRLGIARALALEPKIVFYDDPTAGLDPITSRQVVDLINELQRRRRSSLVAVTNDMARAYQLADRIVMVVDGELIVTGSPAETRHHPDPRVAQFTRGLLDGPLSGSGA
jgi:phospholipid/cholesterol/gamma-HCH transport system ATP-binding protein